MTVSLFDTARRRIVPFSPATPGVVTMYNCGPTVYGTAHVGNFRSFLLADLLRRTLEGEGLEVRQIMNITDVGHLTQDDQADGAGEDKLLQTAARLGWDPFRVARHFEAEFHRDRARLGLLDAHAYPRATEHVPQMLELITGLLERGHAYAVGGDIYFDVSTFPAYGTLSGRDLDEQRCGARVSVREGKRNPEDFALWKVDDGHLMQFDPPKGAHGALRRGFPGWHIECSAMSMHYLGETFDVHTGGEDNLFPHHECEAAQSTALTGQPLACYWLHTRHLLLDGAKLSKRAGTALTLDDLEARGFAPRVVRLALLAHHYRRPMNLTDDALHSAKRAVGRLRELHDRLREVAWEPGPQQTDDRSAAALAERFRAALRHDLDTPAALVPVFEALGRWLDDVPQGSAARAALRALHEVDGVLGVLDDEIRTGVVPAAELDAAAADRDLAEDLAALARGEVRCLDRLLAARHQARARRDFATADQLRDAIGAAGIAVRDVKDGVVWTRCT